MKTVCSLEVEKKLLCTVVARDGNSLGPRNTLVMALIRDETEGRFSFGT